MLYKCFYKYQIFNQTKNFYRFPNQPLSISISVSLFECTKQVWIDMSIIAGIFFSLLNIGSRETQSLLNNICRNFKSRNVDLRFILGICNRFIALSRVFGYWAHLLGLRISLKNIYVFQCVEPMNEKEAKVEREESAWPVKLFLEKKMTKKKSQRENVLVIVEIAFESATSSKLRLFLNNSLPWYSNNILSR